MNPKCTWGIDLDSTDINGDPTVNNKWMLATTKNHMVRSRKCDKCAAVKTDQFIKTTNRFTPLTKVHADNVGTIPVIVNGDISTKGNDNVIKRNVSQRKW